MAQKTVLLNDEGKVLILRFSRKKRTAKALRGKWDFPGGGVKFEESLEAGLKREIREELGAIKYEIEGLIDRWSWVQVNDPTTRTVCLLYRGRFLGGEVRLNEEHDLYKWVEVDELKRFRWTKDDLEQVKRLPLKLNIGCCGCGGC